MFLFYSKHCRARGGLGSLLPCDMSRSVEREDGEKLGPIKPKTAKKKSIN